MATKGINEVVEHLRQAMLRKDGAGLTDGQLLDRFIEHRDEAALEALVRRHGPLIWSICRRVLGNHHDAEDAFQATFLVLVRRAASVVPRDRVANWLYGVASQTARKARATAAKRKMRERLMAQLPEPVAPDSHDDDLHHLLHQALGRLPNKFRVSIILCDLEGKTRTEAARQLGIPEGTLASWLARGRAILAKRLAGHGLVVAAGTLTAALARSTASAAVPVSLVSSTMQAAALLTAEQTTTGMISTPAFALMEGVMKEMLTTKIKMTVTVLLVVIAMIGLSSGGMIYRMQAAEERQSGERQPPPATETPPGDAVFAAVNDDADKDTVVGSGKEGRKEIKVADFVSLEINLPIEIHAAKGDAFRVEIIGDDNLLDLVKVGKEGHALRMSAAKRSWRTNKPLKATITMPALEGLNLDSACQLTIKGFKTNKEFKAKVAAASKLEGSIEAVDMKLDATGASRVKLKGAAKKLRLSATGASFFQLEDFALEDLKLDATGASRVNIKGSAKKAALSAAGASRLQLEEFAIETVKVQLTGASRAAVKVKTDLDYALSGASRLHYQGDPRISKKRASGASSVSHK